MAAKTQVHLFGLVYRATKNPTKQGPWNALDTLWAYRSRVS